jgi:hypothetical protein
LGQCAGRAFRLIEPRQTRHIVEQDGFGRRVVYEIGVGQNDVGIAVIQRKRLGEKVPGALSAEIRLFDSSQSPPGAGIVRVQRDGRFKSARGFGEVGAAEVEFAPETEQGIVGAADGEGGAHQSFRLIALSGNQKLAGAGSGGYRGG